MNDPEIIRKLDEIKQELSGIKDEVSWYRGPLIGFFVIPLSLLGVIGLVDWLLGLGLF